MKDIIMVVPFLNSSEVTQWTREAYQGVDGIDIVGIAVGWEGSIYLSDGKNPLSSWHRIKM